MSKTKYSLEVRELAVRLVREHQRAVQDRIRA